MNTPKIADYTTRRSYQQNYAKENREAINARKRAWRVARKNLSGGGGHHEQRASSNAQSAAIGNETSLSQNT